MERGIVNPAWAELDEFIEAFELAHVSDPEADLADFLPPANHTLYLPVLRELVRVDLEYRWQRGKPKSLDAYRAAFPVLFEDGPSLHDVAFEEYRLRGQAGQLVTPDEYRLRFGIDVSDWPAQLTAIPLEVARRGSDLLGPEEHSPASPFPKPGDEFLGFQLIEELGRGAFGRVYLARQPSLADRLVALKVSTDLWSESQTLAQLQHTNIVPIYSVHRSGPFQAVCMPFLGTITLADVIQDLHQRGILPQSGKGLVSTLASRRRSTLRPSSSAKEIRVGPVKEIPQPPPAEAAGKEKGIPRVDIESLAGMSYVESVLSLAARLADGLAHAHERGILHRDLKPANVLLTDDGQPMLLDFNLSEDVKLRGTVSAAHIGGTLPYMAPEHVEAFDRGSRTLLDQRGDLYALGVILYELLTGRLPFAVPRGPLPVVLARLRQERQKPPRLRAFNPQVSPAVESIVRRCLEPNARDRYQTARELEEDLKRQLDHRPLRYAPEPSLKERTEKLVRRHPRLTAAAGVAAVAGIALLTLGAVLAVKEVRLARAETRNAILNASVEREQSRQEMKEVQVQFLAGQSPADFERAQATCRRALERYNVLDDPSWMDQPAVRYLHPDEQARLQEDVGVLLLLWARATVEQAPRDEPEQRRQRAREALALNEQAERCFEGRNVPRVVLLQRSGLHDLIRKPDEVPNLHQPPLGNSTCTPLDLDLLASEYMLAGRYQEALPLLIRANREEPQRFILALGLAICYDRLERPADAVAAYSTAIALSPKLGHLYYQRGLANLRSKDFDQAVPDLDQARKLAPDLAGDCFLNRAVAHLGQKQFPAAIEDLALADKHGASRVRVYLIRSRVRQQMGDAAAAQQDREKGLKEVPIDTAGWLARGSALLSNDPKAALRDFDQALQLSPRSLPALQNKAHILSERLNRNEEAIRVMDDLVKAYPEYAAGWASRGVLRARKGDRAGAHADARTAQRLSSKPPIVYQAAGVYALTSRQNADDRGKALKLLANALANGYGLDVIDRDPDLGPIRDCPEFRRLVESAKHLKSP